MWTPRWEEAEDAHNAVWKFYVPSWSQVVLSTILGQKGQRVFTKEVMPTLSLGGWVGGDPGVQALQAEGSACAKALRHARAQNI